MNPRKLVRTDDCWALDDGTRTRRLPAGPAALFTTDGLSHLGEAMPVTRRLAPVAPSQEVWAAGVTYRRSLTARSEESAEPDIYQRVYNSERPELFFKATAERVVGPGGVGRIRADSRWNVPEPELVAVISPDGRVVGYTIGDDLSSRDIEGANPLYLPQAKVYEGSCVLGPWLVPAQDVVPPFQIALTVTRSGKTVFTGATSTGHLHRQVEELADWLTRGLLFPAGVLLMTGTGIVPDDFSLAVEDQVRIEISQIGVLEHEVQQWKC